MESNRGKFHTKARLSFSERFCSSVSSALGAHSLNVCDIRMAVLFPMHSSHTFLSLWFLRFGIFDFHHKLINSFAFHYKT